jgi:hypothetical protein
VRLAGSVDRKILRSLTVCMLVSRGPAFKLGMPMLPLSFLENQPRVMYNLKVPAAKLAEAGNRPFTESRELRPRISRGVEIPL